MEYIANVSGRCTVGATPEAQESIDLHKRLIAVAWR
jgi:hypothetical protein